MVTDERRRLEILRSYGALDTPPEEGLDRLTALAKAIFQAPIAFVSLVDERRLWLKSRDGVDLHEMPREAAFCTHALPLDRGGVLVVPNAAEDPRFANHAFVTGKPFIRFCAGAVLTSPEGANLGTLCILDTKLRPDFTQQEGRTLSLLAELVVRELEIARTRHSSNGRRQLLELAEEMSGVGRWRLQVETGTVEWSDEVYRIHGVDRHQFDPQLDSALDFYDAEGRCAVSEHIAAAVRTRSGFSFNLQVRRSDGAWRQVMCKAACEFDGAGEVAALVGVFQDVTEQVDLLRQVSEDRERFRLLTQNATDVIATYRPDGTFTYLSPAVERLLGRSPENLVGRRTFEVIDPRDHARVRAEFNALVTSGDPSRRIQYRALRPDGALLQLEAHPTPMRDAGGQLLGFQDVVRDVTTRQLAQDTAAAAAALAETALARAQESEARYRLLAENANDMISTSSMDSAVVFVTPAVRRVLGYAPEEIIGRKTLELTHPDDKAGVIALFSRLAAAGSTTAVTPYQFRGRHKDGRWVWLEGQPRVQFDEAGRPIAFQDVVRDIEARKSAEEEALRAARTAESARFEAAESEARYRLLAENATDIIARYALDGAILYVSPACRQVLGFSPEELRGRRTLELIHPDDLARIRASFAAYVAAPPETPPVHTEHRVVRKDGRVIWLEGRPRLVRDADGRPVEYHDVMRDITARKAMEAELEQARADADAAAQAKADFLANMSHELRTPLTSIIGYTSLASEQPGLSDVLIDYLRRVRNASGALLGTVNDILDFSKLEAGQVAIHNAPTDVVAVCRNAVELFLPQALAKSLRLATETSGDPPPALLIDPDRLQQLLLNLVGNAVKFTSAGSVKAVVAYGAGRLTIEVRDTGPGIAREALGKLFKRFSQVDGSSTRVHGGSGLGLAICRGLAERMGGAISVRSEVGVGSTFILELPTECASAPLPAAAGGAGAPSLEALRVLVVDDTEVVRELARIVLESAGAEVSEALDGAEALRLLSTQPFDVVLLDLHLADMDGRAVLRHVRARPGPNDAIPVIAFTAEEPDRCRRGIATAGFNGIISKPVDPLDFVAVVRRAVYGDDAGEAQVRVG